MNTRENTIRAYRFGGPERIPVRVGIQGNCYTYYGLDAVASVVKRHPALFPNMDADNLQTPSYPPWRRKGTFTDSWGCVWHVPEDGITGAVRTSPLSDWSGFEDFTSPDPAVENGWTALDWSALKSRAEARRRLDETTPEGDPDFFRLSLRHGHTFLTLEYLRGYENLIFDMADADPRFLALLETVTAFNLEHERHLISLGPDMIGLPEDLGLQNGPLLTPKMFETYIKPSYRRYIEPIKNAGMIVHMHSDGHILDLAEHFLDLGIDVLNVQDRVNGVGNLAELFGGRVAIDLDIDRQSVTVSGSPRDAAELVRSEVDTLRRPEGGLSLKYDWSPPTPLQNVEAVLTELERSGGFSSY